MRVMPCSQTGKNRCRPCWRIEQSKRRGPKSATWKGGYKGRNHKRIEYREWRTSVFERDDYTCQICNKRGAHLNAHHIYPVSGYPKQELDIDNGVTLCEPCHRNIQGKEDNYIEMFLMILNGENAEA